MAWEELEAEAQLLVEEIDHGVTERHEYFLRLKQTLDRMRAYGMPIPDDLAALEAEFDREFVEEAREADEEDN